jgi:hypothetical protein
MKKKGWICTSILRPAANLNAQIAKWRTTAFMTQRIEYGDTSIFSNSKHISMPGCREQNVRNVAQSG